MTSADAVPLIKDASHMSQGSYKLTQNRSHTHTRHSALKSSNRAKLTSLRHGTTTLRATHTPPRTVCTHTTSHHNTAPGATRDTVSGVSAYHWMQSDPTHTHGRSAHASSRTPITRLPFVVATYKETARGAKHLEHVLPQPPLARRAPALRRSRARRVRVAARGASEPATGACGRARPILGRLTCVQHLGAGQVAKLHSTTPAAPGTVLAATARVQCL